MPVRSASGTVAIGYVPRLLRARRARVSVLVIPRMLRTTHAVEQRHELPGEQHDQHQPATLPGRRPRGLNPGVCCRSHRTRLVPGRPWYREPADPGVPTTWLPAAASTASRKMSVGTVMVVLHTR